MVDLLADVTNDLPSSPPSAPLYCPEIPIGKFLIIFRPISDRQPQAVVTVSGCGFDGITIDGHGAVLTEVDGVVTATTMKLIGHPVHP